MTLIPHTPTPAPASDLDAMIRVSQMLAKSSLVPGAYRGKPENVLLAALAGQPFGWDPTMSMRSFHIIDGTPSLKPEIMLALVRRSGHSVSGDTSPTGATITGKRRDTGDEMTVTFTLEDAKRAGLANKNVWKTYPASMCWARALSQLCRMLFPDVVLGAGYTPEELGAADNDPQPVRLTVVQVEDGTTSLSVADAKRAVLDAAGGDREVARTIWDRAGIEGATVPGDVVDELCLQAREATEPAEAELVDESSLDDLGAEWSETEPEGE